MNKKTTIYDYDDDFAHYELDEKERKKLGQVWTPYSLVVKMLDKVEPSHWKDETRTNLDPTMGTGNIIIAMLYRRIVENGQDPLKALKNTYGVELDEQTLNYAHKRIEKFMAHFTKSKKKVHDIVLHNFVCSDIFKWDIEKWCPKKSEEEIMAELGLVY